MRHKLAVLINVRMKCCYKKDWDIPEQRAKPTIFYVFEMVLDAQLNHRAPKSASNIFTQLSWFILLPCLTYLGSDLNSNEWHK